MDATYSPKIPIKNNITDQKKKNIINIGAIPKLKLCQYNNFKIKNTTDKTKLIADNPKPKKVAILMGTFE